MSTMMCQKRFGSFAPLGDADKQAADKIKDGTVLTIDYAVRDNGTDQQRKYAFVLIGLMFESQDKFTDSEKFRQYIMIRLGHCEIFNSPDGPVAIAHSMKRGAMKKDEWIQLINDSLDSGS